MPPKIVIHVIPGSQFSSKVLVALDARGIGHYVNFVDMRPEKRKLPSGGSLVPEMEYDGQVVPDSDAILMYVDKQLRTDFFPPGVPKVAELSRRAGEELAVCVLYYNWIYEPSYYRSMQAPAAKFLPKFICCFRDKVAGMQLAPGRQHFRLKVAKMLNLGDGEDMPEEPQMREQLVAELLRFQAELKSEKQPYLIAGTGKLTAADAALYGQLERLVGDGGDIEAPCSLPELLDDARLARLWSWHSRMKSEHPIKYKGKRPPVE